MRLVAASTEDETGLFELAGSLVDRLGVLLDHAVPVIAAAALVVLAIVARFRLGQVILVALAVSVLLFVVWNITAGCELLASEIAPGTTCSAGDDAAR